MKQELIPALIPELFQSERSAVSHGRREARRWGDTPPAQSLLAVAAHAEAWLVQWQSLASARNLSGKSVGQAIGETFSLVRDRLADNLVRAELSYRGTLLGMRHGVDLIRFLRDAAAAAGDTALAEACSFAFDERTVLVPRHRGMDRLRPERRDLLGR